VEAIEVLTEVVPQLKRTNDLPYEGVAKGSKCGSNLYFAFMFFRSFYFTFP